MSKRIKVFISVSVALVLLAVAGATAVMAQGKPTLASEASTRSRPAIGVEPRIGLGQFYGRVGDNMTNGLLPRVAEILGIPQEELSDAFKQAQQEMKAEAFIRTLDRAVEKGRITQEEADEIKAWYEQKPESLDSGLFHRARNFKAMRGRHMRGQHMQGDHRGWDSGNTTQAG